MMERTVPPMKLLHISHDYQPHTRAFSSLMVRELEQLGELTLLTRGKDMTEAQRAEHIRKCDILLTCWDTSPVPAAIAADRGALKYICHLSGEMRRTILPCHIEAGIPVTNWGDAPARAIAEGAVALMFTVMQNFRPLGKLVEAGLWSGRNVLPYTLLRRLRVGIYGLGVIGRQFVKLIEAFEPIMTGYDPYVSDDLWPSSVKRVDSLDALADGIDALIIHAGLSPETRHSVSAEILAKLPKDGIVVNTARGGLIDQEALMAELRAGRLRAGLDVLDSEVFKDALSMNDPARFFPNLVLTCHDAGISTWPVREELESFHEIALDNLRRFMDGRPLRFVMDIERYERST
jgi:phosphoglycerate dehydrogenase-like enzyme